MATREAGEAGEAGEAVGYDHAARHRIDCGCEVVGLWRRLLRDDPSGRSVAIAVPDGWRIVAACPEHPRLEGTSFTTDDPLPELSGRGYAREAR